MIAFIDDHREAYGVEPICKVLPIAPSTYHAQIAQRIDVSKRSARAQRDSELKIEVQRVFAENFGVYGVRKVWRQLRREGFTVARCTVERLMASLGLQGAIRGKPVRTTISDKAVPCPCTLILVLIVWVFVPLKPSHVFVMGGTSVEAQISAKSSLPQVYTRAVPVFDRADKIQAHKSLTDTLKLFGRQNAIVGDGLGEGNSTLQREAWNFDASRQVCWGFVVWGSLGKPLSHRDDERNKINNGNERVRLSNIHDIEPYNNSISRFNSAKELLSVIGRKPHMFEPQILVGEPQQTHHAPI